MVDYNPHSINQMYEQYSSTHSSKPSNANKTFADSMKAGGGGTNLSGSGSSAMEGLMRSQREQTQKDNDSKPDEDVGGVKSFLENAWSWLSASGGEPEKPKVYDGSSIYSRPEFDPSRYTKPINFSDQDKRIDDMLNNRDDDPGYKDDEYAGSTYDEVEDQDIPAKAPVTIKDAINTAIDNTIATGTYTIQKGDTLSEIAAATGKTVIELKQLNDIQNPRKMQAGATLKIPVQTAQDKEVVEGAKSMSDLKPIKLASQSGVPMEDREFFPEDTSDLNNPQTRQGLMTRSDTANINNPRTKQGLLDTDGINSVAFNDELIDELVDLEGRGGDFLSSVPTYDLGITESKANEYDLDPDDYTTFGDFAKDFTKKYVDEKYIDNKDIFKTVDKENHTALMSYLWNAGSFGPNQTAALEDNDMREFVSEMRDAIGSEGFSSSGLSARRAKEANMIGENLDNWNPITKVVITGTRANPTYTWQDAAGNTVEEYTTTRPLHPQNVTSKPNATDVLNEEIEL